MELLIPLFIYLVVPLIGLFIFRRNFADVDNSVIYAVSLINTAHFGGWFLFLLTSLFWYWSGMATLGFFYLIFIAPILSVGLLIYIFSEENLTNYRYALITSILYSPFAILLFTIGFFATKH